MLAQQQVAEQIWNYLTSRGWTKQSVSALLGNMQSESGIIADRWESDRIGNMSGGYGLVQWTPATKYINWAQSNGLVYQDVISQCKRLEWEVANSQQFYNPNMTFAQFTKSTQSPEVLADIFIRYYERPFNPNQPARGIQARYWLELLKGNTNDNQKGEKKMTIIFNYKGTGYSAIDGVMIAFSDPKAWGAITGIATKNGTAVELGTLTDSQYKLFVKAYKFEV
ncbi:hypothetical protein RU86_GL001515 [Lactococcus piscium]|uniref:Phage tail lysozyme domain-containing protein n=1 Tax=Pseudolactococcus piscium TaxID=1364 RepID=A0A2A5S4W0_9LACT|nr:phage tail tip lysozyme [Lactococcus piscium]PCS08490.1 hypothetical protein RU86_GL001515 [Lactococcus piscium]